MGSAEPAQGTEAERDSRGRGVQAAAGGRPQKEAETSTGTVSRGW